MRKTTIYRPINSLKGKALSAHTVASFIVLQAVSESSNLSPDINMKGDALKYLLRTSAINHWTKEVNGWLIKRDNNYFLTSSGCEKVFDRVNGNAGAYSFSDTLLSEALSRIKGELQDCELEPYVYYENTEEILPPTGISKPKQSVITTSIHGRIKDVKVWILKNSRGICEACKMPAPFKTDSGALYLEVHHVKSLSDGGSDTIENTVALCPNCHRKQHYAAEKNDIKKQLYNRVSRLIKE